MPITLLHHIFILSALKMPRERYMHKKWIHSFSTSNSSAFRTDGIKLLETLLVLL